MIRRTSHSLWFLALSVAFLTQPSWAQEKSYDVTVQFVRATSAPQQFLYDAKAWFAKTDSAAFRVVSEHVFQAKDDKDSLIHVGRKAPIVYKDPRADGYQVQYTDQGMKCDIQVTALSHGMLKVQVRPEHSVASPTTSFPDGVEVMLVESTFVMKRGQTVILGTTEGILNQVYQPKVGGGPGGVLLFALTLQ